MANIAKDNIGETDTRPDRWAAVNGWLDGLETASGSIGGVVDNFANAQEDLARGRGAIANQQQDAQQRDLNMALQLRGFNRGDNNLNALVIGAAAVALILLVK